MAQPTEPEELNVDMERLYLFADRFGQRDLIEKYMDRTRFDKDDNTPFEL